MERINILFSQKIDDQTDTTSESHTEDQTDMTRELEGLENNGQFNNCWSAITEVDLI